MDLAISIALFLVGWFFPQPQGLVYRHIKPWGNGRKVLQRLGMYERYLKWWGDRWVAEAEEVAARKRSAYPGD